MLWYHIYIYIYIYVKPSFIQKLILLGMDVFYHLIHSLTFSLMCGLKLWVKHWNLVKLTYTKVQIQNLCYNIRFKCKTFAIKQCLNSRSSLNIIIMLNRIYHISHTWVSALILSLVSLTSLFGSSANCNKKSTMSFGTKSFTPSHFALCSTKTCS